MRKEIIMAEGAVSSETNAGGSAQTGGPAASEQGSPISKPSFSSDFDPQRTDYETIEAGDYYVYTDPKTGREVARILKIAGGAIDVADEFADAEPGDSRSKNAIDTQKHLLSRDISRLSGARLDEYHERSRLNRQEMDDLIGRALINGILTFVREDLKNLYNQATRPPESSYFRPQAGTDWRAELRRIAEGGYKETFWDYGYDVLRSINLGGAAGPVDVAALKAEFGGLPTYVASKIALAIEKDLKGLPLSPTSEIGDFFLESVKRERVREEARKRERASTDEMLEYSDWRERFDFTWAQSRPELKASVFAWLEKFVAHLPEATIEELNNESLTWKRNSISALEKAANRLRISEKDPFYKELKSTIEAYVEVFRGVKFLETDGGAEAHTVSLEEFAHNFNAKHDAIYLGNVKSAIIQHFLARNHGEIALGAPRTLEKPQAGDTEDFRGNIEEQALLYAATHELYIRPEDFDTRIAENNSGYGWDDVIEELLLVDSRGMVVASALTDPVAQAEAIAKVATRTGVFKRIKERLDREDMYEDTPGHFVNLASLTLDQRKDVIRTRIRDRMLQHGNRRLVASIDAMPDVAAKDRELWNWLKKFNESQERRGYNTWFPSNWDMVRLSINGSTKLVDRVLSEDELEAMIEEVGVFKTRIENIGWVEVEVDGLTEEEIEAEINSRTNLSAAQKKEFLEDALFNKQQREVEAERAFNINRAYQKFLGVDARWGGMAIRTVNENGDVVFKTVWEKAEEILKEKINNEEAAIEAKVTAHEQALRARGGLTDAQIDQAKTQRRRLLRRDSTFGATLALREIGIAHDLPIWNYYYYNDPQRIQTFAPLVGYTHNDKVELVDLLDRGRREMRAVFDYVADQYMDGRVLIVRHEPNVDMDQNGQPRDFHQERWDRARVINEAGVTAIREVVESRFMQSTSGGIEVVDLISKIGDLGIYDLLWEMGCKDFREFQGFIKRRDEVELKKQSFWNIRQWRDPISYAKRLREAGAALPYLRGGEVKGQGRKPGVLQEPMMGAYKVRDFVLDENNWNDNQIRANLKDLVDAAYEKLKPEARDKLVEIGAGILVTLIEYMNARRYVANRAGLAPKNWKYDNELIFREYVKELLKRESFTNELGEIIKAGGETLGGQDLGYAQAGRSKLAVKFYEGILRTSTYHILVERDKTAWEKKGKAIKAEMDTRRRQIETRGLLPEEQRAIDARQAKLQALHTSQDMITDETARMKKQYIDERLHKEFVGEWPAKFAEDFKKAA